MAETVQLLNVRGRGLLTEVFYFYDGETVVDHGVITIPADRPEWVQRAHIMGYRLDPETEQPLTLDEALTGTRPTAPAPAPAPVAEVAVVAESTESAGEEVEGTDLGGQPASEDGLRESEQPRDEGVSGAEVGSSVSDGADARATRTNSIYR